MGEGAEGVLEVYYRSSFSRTFMTYTINGTNWTPPPGEVMGRRSPIRTLLYPHETLTRTDACSASPPLIFVALIYARPAECFGSGPAVRINDSRLRPGSTWQCGGTDGAAGKSSSHSTMAAASGTTVAAHGCAPALQSARPPGKDCCRENFTPVRIMRTRAVLVLL